MEAITWSKFTLGIHNFITNKLKTITIIRMTTSLTTMFSVLRCSPLSPDKDRELFIVTSGTPN